MARVLVTGGTGFIGSALCRSHVALGDSVRSLAKVSTDAERRNAERLGKEGVELLDGSVAEREDVARAMRSVDLVYHVAAAMREANLGLSGYRNVNVGGTRNVLEEAAGSGVEHVVHVSSVGVYGDISGRKVDETSECRPKNVYGVTKLEAERVVAEFAAREGASVVIVRPAEVYGPGDFRLLKLFRMIQCGKLILFGRGRGRHHLIFIDDLVHAMRLAASRRELSGSTFVLAGSEPVELRLFLAEIARQLGVGGPRIRVPLAPALCLAAAVEFACKPLGVEPPIYRRRMDFFRHDWNLDISRARQILGFEPSVGVEAGIARTIAGYRAEGLLK